ncbi:MAG TPA: sugar phosphate isomerase/epimerase [Vicinamibacterales bacterium]|nr:sugar phosphate isomerase/epimerase [Vicinamibacterales bacterium]
MSYLTRREWNALVAGGLVTAPLACLRAESGQPARSVVAGVRLGAQTYSFRDRPLEQVPAAFKAAGLSFCELWSGHAEAAAVPRDTPREQRRELQRTWRLSVPLSHFEGIRAAFADAGVTITSYDVPYQDTWSDEEIARSFDMAKALGVAVITSSAVLSVVPRIAPHAEKARIKVSFHNHSNIRPNEFATPDDFAAAMKVSPMMGATLDIGHFTAANFDAVAYLEQHHDRINALHIKDRKKDQGPNVPFGEGDTPIVAVLRLLRDRTWDIPAHIEYEYRGTDAVAEVTKCYDYCRKALETR